jgi:chromosome segregation ATPase
MGFSKKEMEEKGFTTEQIDFVMAERGKEIEKEKTKLDDLQKQLADKDASITELAEKAKNLDGTESTLKELQDKVATYEQKETERIEAEKQAQIDAELRQRFLANVGENKFKHEDIENGRFNAFKSALADEKFKGKGDAEIFAEVTKDMDLYVNPQQQTITMPGGGFNKNADSLSQARAIMGLPSESK